MAEFNKDQGPLFPDNTSDSKGQGAKTSFANLFGNVGDLAIAGVKVMDQNNLTNIQNEVYKEVDQLNDEWGTRASAFETNVGNPHNIQPTPADLARYGKELSVTRSAYLNGTLRNSQYAQRIDSLSRQIRARYPGYREDIDNIISKTLGQSTANDLRKAYMSEWATEQANMDEATKRYNRIVDKARETGDLPPQYDVLAAKGTPMNENEVVAYIAQRYQINSDKERRITDLKLLDSESEAGIKAAYSTASQEISDLNQKSFEGLLSVGTTIPQLKSQIINGTFKPPSAEENAQIAGYVQKWRTELKSQVLNVLSRPEYSKLSQSQRDDLTKYAMGQVDNLYEAWSNEKYGLISIAKTLNETGVQNALKNWRDKDGRVDYLSMVKKFSDGDAVLSDLILRNPAMRSTLNDALNGLMTSQMWDTTKLSIDQVLQEGTQKQGGQMDPEVIKQVHKNYVETLLKKDVSFETASVAAEKLFSSENQDFLGRFTLKSQDQLFETMTSRRMTERMIELGKTNPQLFRNYSNWTLNAFEALFNQDLNTVVDANKFSDNIQIKWSDEKGKFELLPMGGPNRNTPALGQIYNQWADTAAGKSMERLNKYVAALKPIVEAEGGNGREALTAIFEKNGVNTAQNQGSLFYRMYKALGEGMTIDQSKMEGGYRGRVNPSFNPELNNIDLDKKGSGKMSYDTPRGIRNNNPGNIKAGKFATSQGASGTDGEFAKFNSPQEGINAMYNLLENYQKRGLDTVSDMIGRWAPREENDTEAYVKKVAKAMDIDPDQPFLFNGELAQKMIDAMIEVENGGNPYKKGQKQS